MTEGEKEVVRSIAKEVVKYAYSSHIFRDIYRKYPEAFFKPSKLKPNGD